MELIERYVNEVGRRLPKRQREEVRRELRSALLDAVEGPGGDEPNEDEVVAAIRELGPPEEVAAGYWPADQYLIGPELYPQFKRVVGIVMGALVTLIVVVFGLSLLARPAESAEIGARILGLIGGILDSVWVVFAIIVLVFGGLQRLGVRPEKATRVWDPRGLPAVRDADRIGRGEATVYIVVPAVFLALLFVFRDRIGITIHPGGELLLNDVLGRYLPWIAAALLSSMGLYTFLFWRGRWEWTTRFANLVIDLFGLAVLQRVVVAVTKQKAGLAAAGLPEPVPTLIVQSVWIALAVVAVFIAVDAGKFLLRLTRSA